MSLMPTEGATALVLKDYNTCLVRLALKNARTATIRELAGATGLSMMTVGTIMQGLVASGAAVEAELCPSKGGRPSRLYRFNGMQALNLVAFGREIEGQDTLCLRVADLYGQVLEAEDCPFAPKSLEDFEPPIGRLLARYPAIRALGFGLPGVERGGRIVALDYWRLEGAPILEHFRERYGLPVLFENDVNAAALGRGVREGAAETEVYLYFPRKYAPGAGIRIGSRIIKGCHHFAGEVDWLPLGILWGDLSLSGSLEASSEAIAQVVVSLAAVLDPDSIVLYGEFLTEAHLRAIRSLCARRLPIGMVPELSLTRDFAADFERGLIGLTLELIEA